MNTPERPSDALPGAFPLGRTETGGLGSAPDGRRPVESRSGGNALLPLRRELRWVGGIVVIGGGAVGTAWAKLAPVAQRWSSDGENVAAQDGTLGLLGILAGVLTGLALIVFPSRNPAMRAGVGILASVLGAGLSLLIGRQLGAPALLAPGMVMVWPIITSTVILLRSVTGLLIRGG